MYQKAFRGSKSKWCKQCLGEKDDWKFPYKGIKDPKYIAAKNKLFAEYAKKDRMELGFNW